MNRILILSLLMISAWACKKDDGIADAEIVPPKTLTEAAAENDTEIKAFLQTHFYNYEEFENPSADFDFKIKFDSVIGDNAGKTPLIDRPELQSVTLSVEGNEGESVDHTLYFLVVRQGEGESPTVGDNVVLNYEGSLLDGTVFDSRYYSPNNFYMSGVVRGYGNGVSQFNVGAGPIDNGDGTVSFENYGIGALFMPSGLGYFDTPQSNLIPLYAPLVFKVDVLSFENDTDFDGDGIPSILEDLNGDGNLSNDNTDADSEQAFGVFLANHNDTDDDDDRLPTIEEINLVDGKFDSFKDTDGDGDEDHIDDDDDNDGIPTSEEINIVDGSFDSFRDTDQDGTPDHLDKDS